MYLVSSNYDVIVAGFVLVLVVYVVVDGLNIT